MKRMPLLVQSLFSFLNQNVEYAVLRSYEGLPFEIKSRDIDILVNKSHFFTKKKEIVGLIIEHGFKIITYFQSERMYTFVCGKINNSSELIQLDFFFSTSAYGFVLLSGEEILKNRIRTGTIYHVTKEYEFLDKYLYLKFIGSKYPEKYSVLREKMKVSEELRQLINNKYGVNSLEELEIMSLFEFKKLIIFNCLRRIQNVQNILLFYFYCIKNFINPKGYSIGFTGPDGAGKTTIIDLLIETMATVYPSINYQHFRPLLIGNLGNVIHNIGLKKSVDRQYSKPHRGNKTGLFNSFLRLSYYSLDYIVGYLLKIHKSLFRRDIVIFDRYYTDIICDSPRSRIYLNKKFLYWWGKLFIPKLDYNILLTATTDTILQRKQELDAEGIKAINERIDYLSAKKGYIKVLNESTVDKAATEILNHIFEAQHKKNLKRLRK